MKQKYHWPSHRAGRRSARVLVASLASFAAFCGVAGIGAQSAPSPNARISLQAISALQVSNGYIPSQIEAAYDITPLRSAGIDGTGKTIAFIELDGYRSSDITQFDLAFGLPAAKITKTYQGGTAFKPADHGEATLDLEWAHALAPGAKLHVYYLKSQKASPSSWKAMATAVNTAVKDGATSISISLGTCSPTQGSNVTKLALSHALANGVTTFVSSGDTGPFPGYPKDCGTRLGAGYPASDPSVVSVGGTSLQLNQDNTISGESAWRLSGGGNGHPILRPVWQIASTLLSSNYRQVPDVSFLADPQTGVAMYLKGRWATTGGTSLGAPAWAAIWALLAQNATGTGTTLPAGPATFYKIGNSAAYSQAFHDVITGTNGQYDATTGWDAVTGWGTPDVAQLANVMGTVTAK